ncbi:uncharacterized protein F4817DRAFT_361414 [Daldinia loculata]|uniref:uncharacterized protein n=1 Tax=Daldinia loculata TaxID=103429 RepID=UPI0020C58511|nr:uncharacterized protein F4817DRAFT_361414 [Daldinia loculata]KAI1643564.1 hypothetical protein F4817DRAFT_361414 [Daldinia loculata]
MIVIPNTWFDEKVQDEVATTEQTTALKAYLEDDIEAEEAGMLITADVHQETLADTTSAEEINEELCKLWGFIIDVIVDWPSEHIKIANLLDTISKLPHVDRTGRDSLEVFMDGTGTVRASELWQDLPRFWNSFSDYWHSSAGWPYSRPESSAEKAANSQWTNINSFAAIVFMGGPFADMPLLGDWGCYVIKKASRSDYEPVEVHIPSAAVWMRFAGKELYHFYLTRYEGPLMRERWEGWRKEFKKICRNDTVDADIRENAAELAALMGMSL